MSTLTVNVDAYRSKPYRNLYQACQHARDTPFGIDTLDALKMTTVSLDIGRGVILTERPSVTPTSGHRRRFASHLFVPSAFGDSGGNRACGQWGERSKVSEESLERESAQVGVR